MLQVPALARQGISAQQSIHVADQRGIGLISMKQIAAHYLGDKPQGNILQDVVRRVPVLAERKLTAYQGSPSFGRRKNISQFFENATDRRFICCPKHDLTVACQLTEVAQPAIVHKQLCQIRVHAANKAS